jgi:four helix bundle protein
MGSFKSFEEILAWQKARELCKEVYDISLNEGFKKDYGLVDQIRRASVSVMANIAEGYERRGDKEFVRFLNIAKGSLAEVKSHLYIAFDLNYITTSEKDELFAITDETGKIISGLISYLKKNIGKPRTNDLTLTTKD